MRIDFLKMLLYNEPNTKGGAEVEKYQYYNEQGKTNMPDYLTMTDYFFELLMNLDTDAQMDYLNYRVSLSEQETQEKKELPCASLPIIEKR